MRKKWGMILGLTGMMLLGSQSIYVAEAADGTAETTDAANEKETAGADDIEGKIKKGGFTAGASVHDPSVIKDNDTYYIFGSHMESAKSTDLRNWTGFSSGVNAENKLFDNLFDGEEDGDPAAFTYVGKNEEGGYSVWAPDVIYNKKKVVIKEIQQRARCLTSQSTSQRTGIILYTRTKSCLPHHLHIKVGSLLDTLSLNEFVL